MYLGIDLGTSEIKLVVLDPERGIVASAGSPLSVQRPRPLWSEQDPRAWWAGLEAAIGKLRAGFDVSAIRAIGLSGQMHGAVALDPAGRVLRPAILWNDGRSGEACAALEAAVPHLHQIAGNLAMPGFTAPKLWWLRENEPEIFARTACVLLPKDWLRFELTGERISDCSDASGTLWLDVGARRWSPAVLAACGMSEAQMPRLVEGSQPAGRLRGEIASRFGLKPGIVVAGGGGDNAASAVGIGAVAPGQGFVSLGTSGVIFVCGDRFMPNPASAVHAFCHALPGRWHQMAVMLSAASALRWATQLTGLAGEAELVAKAEALSAADRDSAPIFLPYLAGERTPHNDPLAEGALIGLTHSHGAAQVGYSVLEGVAFGLADGWDSLDSGLREQVGALSLVGGGSRSGFWATLIASLVSRPLDLCEGSEAGAALGAARLAWLADLGSAASDRLAEVCAPAPVRGRYEPDAAWRGRLMSRRERFRKLYPALLAARQGA